MGLMDQLKKITRPYEYDDAGDDVFSGFSSNESKSPSRSGEAAETRDKVVSIHTTTQLQVVVVQPDKYEDARDIADHLRDRRTVLLNLEKANKDAIRRLLDFLSGVVYAQGGRIKPVAKSTYIITPFNVDVMGGDLMDELESNGWF